jgi:hypothetical protein
MSDASAVLASRGYELDQLGLKKLAAITIDLKAYGDSFEEWLATESHDSTHLFKKLSCPYDHAERSFDKKKSLQTYCKGMSLSKCDRIYTDNRIFLLLQFSGTYTGYPPYVQVQPLCRRNRDQKPRPVVAHGLAHMKVGLLERHN